VDDTVQYCNALPQVDIACTREEAAVVFEMPLDREGDFVAISEKNALVGSGREEHNLSALQGHRLRSHGGLSEQEIRLIRSTPQVPRNRLAPGAWINFKYLRRRS